MTRYLSLLILFWAHLSVANNQFSEFFNHLESLSANFVQHTYSEDGTLINTASGSLLFNRPKQLKWHTTQPNEQILLLQNNELWLVDVELEQASLQKIQNLSETPLYWLINKPNLIKDTPTLPHQQADFSWYKTSNSTSGNSSKHPSLSFGFENKKLKAISFQNALAQTVNIVFDTVLVNLAIDTKRFELNLGPAFDIIR